MSYSRWSRESYWYTYRLAGTGYNKLKEIFIINTDLSFSYEELKENIDFCLKKVFDHENENEKFKKEFLIPLKEQMMEFMKDIEDEYLPKEDFVKNLRFEDLPLYINHEDEYVKSLVRERLEKSEI